MSADFRQRQEFVFGEEGEHIVADGLIRRGWIVMPVYQYHNHDAAPVLYMAHGAGSSTMVLPDLMCFGRSTLFAEVKRKTRWVNWKGRIETGFNDRLFREYQAVEERTKIPVVVFFVHEGEKPCGVFSAPLSRLAPTLRVWDGLHCRTGSRIEQPLALFDAKALRLAWAL